MSGIQEVVVKSREITGKEESGRLRRAGHVPSVVYGLGKEPTSVTVEPKQIHTILKSEKGLNSVLNLRLEGTEQTRHVMIKDLDRHPVTNRLTHVDFLRIDMDKKVKAMIPLNFTGSPAGVKLGGVLTMVRHEVEIECLPKDLMGAITVSVSGLGLDDKLTIGDLPNPEGVTYTLGAKRTVAVVHHEKAVIVDDEEGEDEE